MSDGQPKKGASEEEIEKLLGKSTRGEHPTKKTYVRRTYSGGRYVDFYKNKAQFWGPPEAFAKPPPRSMAAVIAIVLFTLGVVGIVIMLVRTAGDDASKETPPTATHRPTIPPPTTGRPKIPPLRP